MHKYEMERIFVIGYMGTPRRQYAEMLCQKLNQEILEKNQVPVELPLFQHLDMDSEIERLDGRTILRLCMTMGEHEYRNREYELLSKLSDPAFDMGIAKEEEYPRSLVISCGDGILLDEMCMEILKKYAEKSNYTVDLNCEDVSVLSGFDKNNIEDSGVILLSATLEDMWQAAKLDKALPYAFMHTGTEEARKSKFEEIYTARKHLYDSLGKL